MNIENMSTTATLANMPDLLSQLRLPLVSLC
jgi:hypothetical protein